MMVVGLLVALAVGGFFTWKRFFAAAPIPDNVILLSGRVEGDDSAVSPKTTGRVLEIRYREGDSVQAGEIIAILDDQQLRARVDQANAALMQSLARLKSDHDQIAVLQAQLQQNQAEVAQQEASFKIADFDRDAYSRLAKTGAVSERQGKQAEATAEQQAAAVAAAKRRVATVEMQLAQQQAEIASAAAASLQARAQLNEAQANKQDLIVPDGQIGKVKIGQPARVYLDSNPTQAIDAYVSRIDPQATFTPENTYFRDDRIKQVVGVKLQLRGAVGFAKPGMPADGAILTSGDQWPGGRWRK
jgi:HlyD family secretion protein